MRPGEVRPSEICPAKLRPNNVCPAEICSDEVRAAYVLPAEVGLDEVRPHRRLFLPPGIPRIGPLPEPFEVVRIRHRWGNLPILGSSTVSGTARVPRVQLAHIPAHRNFGLPNHSRRRL